ncbi:cytochrome P450 [Pseudonocardia sp. ICBG1293]|uniref:cytochrome P450 family protein n=1 Tax=Pseudonocardia sp. ICBG1293 TaxID=2844382 RepID=UPI001CCF039C|nr:cytochrome P450 [Pseudonocardia sp. ICBG1293]
MASTPTTTTGSRELFSGDFWENPYPAYTDLREDEPVRRVTGPDGPFWLISRYDDVREAFVDPRLSKDWRHTLPADQRAGQSAAPTPMMILMDPPDHTRLRKLVGRSFTLRRMNALQPRVEQIAADLLADLPEEGTVDLMERYAFLLPVLVICELLGVPAEDRDQFAAWSNVMVDESSAEESMAAMGKLSGYLSELIGRKRAEPDDALLSSLAAVSDEDGDRLSQEELVAMAVLLLVAGHETTVNLIGNGVLALLTHPEQLARLRADPSLVPTAIEELLRFDTPVVQAPMRFTAEDVTFSGTTIPAGEMVMLGLGTANRDPRWVERPDELDVGREPASGVFFGHGVHFCLGAQLARIEGRVAIGRLIADRPDLALAVPPSELVRRRSTFVRGLASMPVHAGPRA